MQKLKNNMAYNLSMMEEISIDLNIREPFANAVFPSLNDKKKVAYSIALRNHSEILLVSSYGFSINSVFAGLSEKHIEHIANHGPKDYKENIIKTLKDEKMMKGVFEIVKAMDEDLGRGSTSNQDRIKKVIQYIKDNRVTFKFN